MATIAVRMEADLSEGMYQKGDPNLRRADVKRIRPRREGLYAAPCQEAADGTDRKFDVRPART